jgi:TolA-binding protein
MSGAERDREESFEERWRSAGAERAEVEALAVEVAAAEAEPRVRVNISLRQIAARGIRARERRMQWALAATAAVAIAVVWFARPRNEETSVAPQQIAEQQLRPEVQVSKSTVEGAPPRELVLRPRDLDRSAKEVEVSIERVAPSQAFPPESSLQKAAGRPTLEDSPGPEKKRAKNHASEPVPVLKENPTSVVEELRPPAKIGRQIEEERDEPGSAPRVVEAAAPAQKKALEDRAAEIALYRKALEQLRGGQPDDAADTFREYLSRYPSGTLRDEAELSLIEALAAAGEDEDLQAEATRWLKKHPHHPRAKEVKRLAKKD